MKISLCLSHSLRIRKVIALFAAFAVVLVCAFVNVSVAWAEDNGDDNNAEPSADSAQLQSQPIQPLNMECTDYEWQDSFGGSVPVNAEVVIDIAEVADGAPCLAVKSAETNDVYSDRNKVKKVEFTNVGTVTDLTVGDNAFKQLSGASDNLLESVTFPTGLKSLSVGSSAFFQIAYHNNALAKITFPTVLEHLEVGSQAFQQSAATGDNALTEVTFPTVLSSLSIGNSAFEQFARNNIALRNFVMPYTQSDVDNIEITLGNNITALDGSNVEDDNGEEPEVSVVIEDSATAFAEEGVIHTIDGNLPWKWYGKAMSAAEMAEAWGVGDGYTLEHIDAPFSIPDNGDDDSAIDEQNDGSGSGAHGLAETGVSTLTLFALLSILAFAGVSTRAPFFRRLRR